MGVDENVLGLIEQLEIDLKKGINQDTVLKRVSYIHQEMDRRQNEGRTALNNVLRKLQEYNLKIINNPSLASDGQLGRIIYELQRTLKVLELIEEEIA